MVSSIPIEYKWSGFKKLFQLTTTTTTNNNDNNDTNCRNLTRENMDTARKEKPLKKTESLLIAVQNNAIRTNYIKAKNR